jgi:hypothetical protein
MRRLQGRKMENKRKARETTACTFIETAGGIVK